MFSFKKYQLYGQEQKEDPIELRRFSSYAGRTNSSNAQRQEEMRRSRGSKGPSGRGTTSSSASVDPSMMDPFMRNLSQNHNAKEQQEKTGAVRDLKAFFSRSRHNVASNFGVFSVLRKTLNRLTPSVAKLVLQDIMYLVSGAVNQLDSQAVSSDGKQFTNEQKQRNFDRAVADLSAALQKVSKASGGEQVVAQISGQISGLITARDDIGRWDEALGNTILNGDSETIDKVADGKDVDPDKLGKGSSVLAAQVVTSLYEKDENGKAEDILENISRSAEKLEKANAKLTSRTAKDQRNVDANVAGFGQFASDEAQLSKAIQAQRKSHGSFEQLEALAGNSIELFNGLHMLSNEVPKSPQKKYLDDSIDSFAEVFPEAAELTSSGSQALNRIMFDSESLNGRDPSKPTFFERTVQVSKTAGKGKKALKTLANFYLSRQAKSVLEKAAAGQLSASSAQFQGLLRKATLLGIPDEDVEGLVTSFDTLRNSGDSQQALQNFKKDLDDVDIFDSSTTLGRTLGLAGLAIATINLVNNVPKRGEYDLRSSIQTLSDTVGFGKAGLHLLGSNKAWVKVVNNKLALAGKSLAAVGLAFAVHDTVESIKDKDWAATVTGGMGIASGVLGLLGFGGAGFVVGLAAMAIAFQMNRVKASNVLENEHTEAFLMSLGISEETAHHLRNADSEGRSIGPVLVGLMEYTGTARAQMLNALITLSPSQALDLAEACHGVDPDKDGNLPDTDLYADYAGRSPDDLDADNSINYRYGTGAEKDADRPHSLEGLRNYILRRKLPIPISTAS
jgi:hypothetical protein